MSLLPHPRHPELVEGRAHRTVTLRPAQRDVDEPVANTGNTPELLEQASPMGNPVVFGVVRDVSANCSLAHGGCDAALA